ncbi:MAG: hypothetical protein QNJ63_20820 [Calothrix sp. MO_192.B10]|nr:hypothetical protein [Calothrix sp. MO_192.B10]
MKTRKFHTDTPSMTCKHLDSMQPHCKLILGVYLLFINNLAIAISIFGKTYYN